MKTLVQRINAMTSVKHPLASSGLRRGFLLLLLGFSCALLPTVRAVDPPPDGGYPNQNTAEGEDALFSLTSGESNTATGFDALFSDTTGSFNTAVGVDALTTNTTGSANTAVGVGALVFNTTGNSNVASGESALNHNTTGSANTATGGSALLGNTTGFENTATGAAALTLNTTGAGNTAIGVSALFSNNGNSNIALGFNAGINLTTGSNNIDIGNTGVIGESKTIRIGTRQTHRASFIAGVSGVTVATGVGVIINPQGQLGTVVSSARYKDGIKSMDKVSETILSLKPVTFRYKHELDPDGIPQFGLVAEEVEKVDSDLVARDEQGKPYTVRYEAVNAMLLNEFLKEHRKVEEQGAELKGLRETIAELKSALKEQAAQIQQVKAQVQTQRSAPRIVEN